MSRRHHGRSRHAGQRRPDGQAATRPTPPTRPTSVDADATSRPPEATSAALAADPVPAPEAAAAPAASTEIRTNGNGQPHQNVQPQQNGHAAAANGHPAANGQPASHRQGGNGQPNQPGGNGCTAPQLRRFIKSRPYVPMHELRRRFGINGNDDDVTQVRLDDGAVYVGLPDREGHLLGELLRGGEIGYELSLDPRTPIVIGVYPMRPVPRT
jgi:hypothetical protein